MFAEYAYFKRYLMSALEATPELYAHALEGLTPEEADFRPDPERFTIREAVAHVAEWDTIFLQRMQRICQEDLPLLPDIDEGQIALDHDYAHTDPQAQWSLLQERRAELIAFLQARSEADWLRQGNRPEIGLITLETLSLVIPLHDTYHLRQIQAWRQKHKAT